MEMIGTRHAYKNDAKLSNQPVKTDAVRLILGENRFENFDLPYFIKIDFISVQAKWSFKKTKLKRQATFTGGARYLRPNIAEKNLRTFTIISSNTSSANIGECANIAENGQYRRIFSRFL
jgi:hypothetical protein